MERKLKHKLRKAQEHKAQTEIDLELKELRLKDELARIKYRYNRVYYLNICSQLNAIIYLFQDHFDM